MAIWYLEGGRDNDVAISTRVRLARNIKGIPFTDMMDQNQAQKVIDMGKDAILNSNSVIAKDFKFLSTGAMNAVDKQTLVEKHMISPAMLRDEQVQGVLLSDDGHISILLNEEDHIRIQSIFGGFSLNEAWELADKIDDLIEERIEYAFSERYGYLTACPTNAGTGMRASVMLHLPGLSITGNIGNMISAAGKWGMAVRGLYGEGSKAQGDFYQISNQVTMGVTEEESISKLREVAEVIISNEREMRQRLKESGNPAFLDKISRSYGTLRHAYTLSTSEFLQLLSDVRLGAAIGIIKDIDLNALNRLLVETGPAHIIKSGARELQAHERDIARAEAVRAALK